MIGKYKLLFIVKNPIWWYKNRNWINDLEKRLAK